MDVVVRKASHGEVKVRTCLAPRAISQLSCGKVSDTFWRYGSTGTYAPGFVVFLSVASRNSLSDHTARDDQEHC